MRILRDVAAVCGHPLLAVPQVLYVRRPLRRRPLNLWCVWRMLGWRRRFEHGATVRRSRRSDKVGALMYVLPDRRTREWKAATRRGIRAAVA